MDEEYGKPYEQSSCTESEEILSNVYSETEKAKGKYIWLGLVIGIIFLLILLILLISLLR